MELRKKTFLLKVTRKATLLEILKKNKFPIFEIRTKHRSTFSISVLERKIAFLETMIRDKKSTIIMNDSDTSFINTQERFNKITNFFEYIFQSSHFIDYEMCQKALDDINESLILEQNSDFFTEGL